MPYKLTISDEAQADIELAVEYYFAVSRKLGKRFLSELRKAQKHIAKNPNQFQIRYSKVRICFTKTFPFGLHYQIIKDTIVVFALFHTSQDSANWTIK